MRPQQRNNNTVTITCNDCGSSDIKKRKNYSHGNGSKAKLSYSCKNCNSTNIEKTSSRRQFRR